MNVCVIYFDGFWGYEVGVALNILKKENIFSIALEDRVYLNEANQKLIPDKTIKETNPDDIDILIIPGGNPYNLFDKPEFKDFLTKLNEKNKYIAGICAGTIIMANYGLLDNKRCTTIGRSDDFPFKHLFEKSSRVNEDVVIDENIITATGQAFIEFAVELGKVMNVFENNEAAIRKYEWLKHSKY